MTRYKVWLLIFLVLLLGAAAYIPSLGNDFSGLDDTSYIINNEQIRSLSVSSLAKIFSEFVVGNYQPLTILSFAIDYKIFQLKPFFFHLTNLLLHLGNAGLVCWFIILLCRNWFIALFVSVFFLVHPMHVESVVWVSERKDVLFLFFYMWGLIIYCVLFDRILNKIFKNFLVLLFFILALLSKPTAVSFPIVLLLIDYYRSGKIDKKQIFDKTPFFILSLIFGCIALYAAQTPFMAYEIVSPEQLNFNFVERVLLSTYALWDYMVKFFLPFNLSFFYPYPKSGGLLNLYLSIYMLGFVGLIWLILKNFKRQRVLIFGLSFFVFTIVFNLPCFGAGYSISADRFTYLPYLGLAFATGFYIEQYILTASFNKRYYLLVILVFIAVWFSFLTFQRSKVWKNSGTLWADVVKKYPKHPLGYDNLAGYYLDKKNYSFAIALCDKALSLDHKYYTAHYTKGVIYMKTQKWDEALKEYNQALEIFPYYFQALFSRGGVYFYKGELSKALLDYNKALSIQPNDRNTLNNKEIVRRLLSEKK
ncbi:MAG: tetratricopeptide repeat protein [Candidatus Omnitrophica bacterium]|nr:tetratricopeptide repeat protein [Candidatus Omnitrophota bacterium]